MNNGMYAFHLKKLLASECNIIYFTESIARGSVSLLLHIGKQNTRNLMYAV